MVTGKKEGTPDTGIRRAWRPLALVMLVAVLGFWWLQWQSAPTSGGEMMSDKTQYSSRGHDDDD